MFKNTLPKIIFLLVIIALPFTMKAQYNSIEVQKAQLIYKIIEQLQWPNDNEMNYILIGTVNSSPELLKQLKKKKPSYIGTGIKVEIHNFNSVDEIQAINVKGVNVFPHIIYLEKNTETEIKQVLSKINNKTTLLITDNWGNNKDIMVDLFIDKNVKRVGFAFSFKNIENQGISVPDRFIGLGGKNLNAQTLLDKTEKELKAKENQLQAKEDEIQAKEDEIREKQVEIIDKKKQIIKKNNELLIKEKEVQIIESNLTKKESEIEVKEKKLKNLQVRANQHQQQLDEKVAVINNKEKEINEQKHNIDIYKNKILNQVKEFEDQAKLLEEQTQLVEEQKEIVEKYTEEIDSKKAELRKLNFTIQMQRYAIGVFILLLIVIVILLFFIFKNLRQKKRQNALLEEKNAEIQAQSEELENINVELEKLSIVASETSNAVAILDFKGEFEWINSGYTKLYGYTLQLLKSELGDSIVDTSSHPDIDKIVNECIANKKSILYETYITSRGGKKRWAQTSLSPILDSKNNVTKLVIIDSDITKIKEAEEQIKQQNKKIIAQAGELENKNFELAKLSIVAEKIDNAVIIADAKGEIEWVNSGFERLHDITFADFKKIHGSNLIQSNLKPEILDKIAQGLKSKTSIVYSSQTETQNGKKIWLQTTLTPMFDNDGKLIKLFAIDSDITQIKLAEQQIAKQHKSITNSILYARRIQAAVLPPTEFIDSLQLEHFILFRPRDIVSGDFYWFTEVDNKILFTIADCTGHGVPGAFMSMLGISFLNEITGKLGVKKLRPDYILNELRAKVKKYLRQTEIGAEAHDGMDLAFGMLDREQKILQYAGANNPLILIRDNELQQILPDEMPIGIYYNEKASFTNNIIKYKKDDVIYMFSDGYPDQFKGKSRRKFMIKRFRKLLHDIHKKPLLEQKEILEKTLDDWQGDGNQLDDVLVMGMKL